MKKITYWKRESIIDGSLIALFKIEETNCEMTGFIFKDGEWKEHNTIVAKAGWDDDYDYISKEEAEVLINKVVKEATDMIEK